MGVWVWLLQHGGVSEGDGNQPWYLFWSGFEPDLVQLAFVGAIVSWFRQHRCHKKRCWRLQWHPHPKHGHPVCKKHHPHNEEDL